jgi:hypothetical protein
MSTTKHTPGPWTAKAHISYPGFGYVPEVMGDECSLVSMPDAVLMSSAPILLENAKAALATLEQHKTFPADVEAAKMFLRAAIAKATND